MSAEPITPGHPVVDFAHAVTARLAELTARPVWSMTPDQQRDTLRELAKAKAQLEALRLRVLAEAERSGAGQERAAPTAAEWVAIETRQTRISARSDLKLADALETHVVLSSGLASGEVNVEQARVIIKALDRLPTTGEFAVDAAQREHAEKHLVSLAADYDAKALAALGGKLFEVIAPDLAEAFEGKTLEAEEAKAARRTTLTMWEDDEGTTHGRFRIPAKHGQMLKKMILALTSPARSGIDPDLPAPVRNGIAFTELIESISARELPRTGGCGATIVVTMTLEQLLADLDEAGVCTLDTGGRITAGEARRLACRAGIIPMVLGGKSQLLDVGGKRRFHTEGMRIAMGVRDGGCSAEHCEAPPGLCHAHHDVPWAAGGRTDLRTGRLLCPHHHRRIHDPRFETARHSNGTVSFHRRT